MNHSRRLVVCLLLAMQALVPSLHPQGSLTPPGAPEPTMKSLDQIASTGIPVNSTTCPGDSNNLFIIRGSGSHYLTGNIYNFGNGAKNGIQITNTYYVSLDLNGYSVFNGIGLTGGGAGITDGGGNLYNITIKNGNVSGWKNGGIDLSHSTFSIVSNVQALANPGFGMSLGDQCSVVNCVCRQNTSDNLICGYNATISGCSAVGSINGYGFNIGQDSQLWGCVSNFNKRSGFNLAPNCSFSYSSAGENTGPGVTASNGNSLQSVGAFKNGTGATAAGILVGAGCTLASCTAYSNLAVYGIATGYGCTLDHCSAAYNTSSSSPSAGIYTAASTVRGCSALSNVTSYSTPGNFTGMGIYSNDCTIEGCTSTGNRGDGINVISRCLIKTCTSSNNGFAGIHATGGDSRIDGNQSVANGIGVLVDGTVNLIVANSARDNSPNYSIMAGNRTATIVVPAANDFISGNSGGSTFSTDAFANIAY